MKPKIFVYTAPMGHEDFIALMNTLSAMKSERFEITMVPRNTPASEWHDVAERLLQESYLAAFFPEGHGASQDWHMGALLQTFGLKQTVVFYREYFPTKSEEVMASFIKARDRPHTRIAHYRGSTDPARVASIVACIAARLDEPWTAPIRMPRMPAAAS